MENERFWTKSYDPGVGDLSPDQWETSYVVSGVSPLLSAPEMKHQLTDSKARALVTLDAVFAATVTKIADQLPDLKLVVIAGVGGFLSPVKRFLGKRPGKIPQGRVTPLAGKSVVKIEKVIKGSAYSGDDPGVAVTPDDDER